MPLHLKNPHSVLAAMDQRPQDVHWIALPRGGGGDAWQKAAELAASVGIMVRTGDTIGDFRPWGARGGKSHGAPKAGREGGAVAEVRERPAASLDELFDAADIEDASPRVWLALDCVQDPHNLGAIFRTAAFFGARGLLILADRSASLTDTVYDVAAGGVEYVPHAVVTNLRAALDRAKVAGIWTLGTSEHAAMELHDVDRGLPWLIVLGNEEKGLRRLTIESCDQMCRVASCGGVTSLNVSVAAGVIMSYMTGEISTK